MSVYRVIDVIGTSTRGGGARRRRASRAPRCATSAWAKSSSRTCTSKRRLTYRVKLALSFKYEEGDGAEPYLERSWRTCAPRSFAVGPIADARRVGPPAPRFRHDGEDRAPKATVRSVTVSTSVTAS
jgi:flavin-binding protein dodecin